MQTPGSSDLTQKILSSNIWRLVFTLSPPAVIGMSINAINAFVDGLFVGRFVGESALAAISLAFPLMMITNGFAAMIGVGGSSLLSIAIGKRDEDTQRKLFGMVSVLSLIVSLILSCLGIYFAEELIGFLGGTGDILSEGVIYYRIVMLGAVFRIFAVGVNMLIRAEGKVTEAMTLGIVATLINLILDPIFIYVLDWGIAGAAWATVAAMAVFSLLGILYYVMGRASYPVSMTYFKLEASLLKPMLAIGVSAMMMQIMFFLQQVLVFKSLASYGSDRDIAIMGVCYRIFLMGIFPSFGLAQAMQPVVGINFGAKKFSRVRESLLKFSLSGILLLGIIWIFILLYPATILGWMMPDTALFPQDMFNLRMMMLTMPLLPVLFMGSTFFQSINEARKAGILLVLREILLFAPAVLLVPLWFGVDGIYYAFIPVNLIATWVILWMVWGQFGNWKDSSIPLRPSQK